MMANSPEQVINRSQVLAGLAVAIVITAATGYYFWPEQAEDVAPGTADVAPRQTVLGPGSLSGLQGDGSLLARTADAQSGPPAGVAVADNQHLLVNFELRGVLDYFLLERADPDRVSAMQQYLQSKLPAPAYADARQIVEHYQAYMQAHDALLASQNLGSPNTEPHNLDVYRIVSWKEQRDRLRLNMLGEPAVQAWYAEDDERLNKALQRLQSARNASDNATGQTQNAGNDDVQRFPGRRDVSTDDMQEAEIYEIIGRETTSFKTLALAMQQWVPRYQAFLGDMKQINEKQGLSPMERNQQIYELLLKKFPDKAERQRARYRLPQS
jgi:lipase chaperone LimK